MRASIQRRTAQPVKGIGEIIAAKTLEGRAEVKIRCM